MEMEKKVAQNDNEMSNIKALGVYKTRKKEKYNILEHKYHINKKSRRNQVKNEHQTEKDQMNSE